MSHVTDESMKVELIKSRITIEISKRHSTDDTLIDALLCGYAVSRQLKELSGTTRLGIDWCPDDDEEDEEHFCKMEVVLDHKQPVLSIANLPIDVHVEDCLRRLGARITNSEAGNRVDIDITPESAELIKTVSVAVQQVVGFDHTRPRTSRLLAGFAEALNAFARQPVSAVEPFRRIIQSFSPSSLIRKAATGAGVVA